MLLSKNNSNPPPFLLIWWAPMKLYSGKANGYSCYHWVMSLWHQPLKNWLSVAGASLPRGQVCVDTTYIHMAKCKMLRWNMIKINQFCHWTSTQNSCCIMIYPFSYVDNEIVVCIKILKLNIFVWVRVIWIIQEILHLISTVMFVGVKLSEFRVILRPGYWWYCGICDISYRIMSLIMNLISFPFQGDNYDSYMFIL